jgi:hypothetical protein
MRHRLSENELTVRRSYTMPVSYAQHVAASGGSRYIRELIRADMALDALKSIRQKLSMHQDYNFTIDECKRLAESIDSNLFDLI